MNSDILQTSGASADLTLLLVEDDEITSEMVVLRLGGLFKHVETIANGLDGLRLFHELTPDIVLTDQNMPGLSGLEMIRQIRQTDQATPIILMTYSMDHETLVEAINLGVTKFIAKPFKYELFIRVFNDLIKDIVSKRQLENSRLQEIELLRYREKYNSMQQEAARHKERHVLRHDLRDQILNGSGDINWSIEVVHSSRDTMCGDGYAIRTIFDGRQFLFVVDAMGSGLSASLSALLATSFCNYQVEHLDKWQDFSLRLFLNRFKEYMAVILVEDEVLSCGFTLLDLKSQEIETAFFGLPPVFVRQTDGSVYRIPGANPPLCMYTDQIRTSKNSLADVCDLLIMTDGFTDAMVQGDGMYRDRLEKDFMMSPTLGDLLNMFRSHTEADDLDDLTLIHLHRLGRATA